MSHLKEREEKVCLNCNAALHGTYCHICGQENIEPKESAWHLITHFFNDITHFDGKFFSTLGLLITRPGFLPSEYARGRRASYLNPIRMYVFTSAIFFLIFFTMVHITDRTIDNTLRIEGRTVDEIKLLPADSLRIFTAKLNHGKPVAKDELDSFINSYKSREGFHFTSSRYKTRKEYDSVLQKGIKKHNWLERKLIYKEIEANERYQNNLSAFITALVSGFLHNFPKMFFISLPLFALILKLLYTRRKEFYYVSHGIFSIHFYVFVFITLLVMFGLKELKELLHWEFLKYLQMLLVASIFFYLYKAMRNFYQQGRGKTIVKFLLLNLVSAFMIIILFIGFFLFSFMMI